MFVEKYKCFIMFDFCLLFFKLFFVVVEFFFVKKFLGKICTVNNFLAKYLDLLSIAFMIC